MITESFSETFFGFVPRRVVRLARRGDAAEAIFGVRDFSTALGFSPFGLRRVGGKGEESKAVLKYRTPKMIQPRRAVPKRSRNNSNDAPS